MISARKTTPKGPTSQPGKHGHGPMQPQSRAVAVSSDAFDAGPRLRLGDILVERKLISAEQLKQALEVQTQKGHKKLLGEVLIDLGFVTEQQVLEILAESYGVPFATHTA